MKQIVIIGARGYGRVVCNIVKECIKSGVEYAIKGFLDSNKCALDGYNGYPPILSSVEDYDIEEDDVFVCAMGSVKYKKIYASIVLQKGGKFINIISNTAHIMQNASIGNGCIIGDNVHIQCDTKIGDFVTILGGAIVGHDTIVEKWSHLGSQTFMGGFSVIKEGATLHTGAKILPHKIVGTYSTIGIGSVVLTNIKDNATVYGNPAKSIQI